MKKELTNKDLEELYQKLIDSSAQVYTSQSDGLAGAPLVLGPEDRRKIGVDEEKYQKAWEEYWDDHQPTNNNRS